jgi:hypothetical protein
MYEYISVWAAAKKTGLEPYAPSCMIRDLEKIFRSVPVHPLSYLAYCTVEELPIPVTADKLEHSNGSIILLKYVFNLALIPLKFIQFLFEININQLCLINTQDFISA